MDFSAVLDRRPAVRAAAALLGALLLSGALAGAAPGPARVALARLANPFAETTWPRATHPVPSRPVEAVEPPAVASLSVRLFPPDYTGRRPAPGPRRLRGLVGTGIEIDGAATRPLRSARIVLEGGASIPADISADGRRFHVPPSRWRIEKSSFYQIELTGRDGLRGADDRWPIDAVADAPPQVTIEQPAADLYVAPGSVVPIRIAGSDDLAIREIGLTIRLESPGAAFGADKAGTTPALRDEAGETSAPQVATRQVERRQLFAGPARPAPRPGDPLDAAAGAWAADHRTVEYRLELASLRLQPGIQVDLWATATDYHDQIGKSEVRRLIVLAPEELRERLAARQGRLAAELERLLHMERNCRQQVGAIERRLLGARGIGPADLDDLASAESGQREVSESLARRGDGAPGRLRELLTELADSSVAEADPFRPVVAVMAAIDRLGREILRPLAGDLLAAAKTAQIDRERPGGDGPKRVAALLRRAAGQQDRVIEALRQWLAALGQFDRLRRWQRNLEQLRRDQVALADRTRQVGRRTLTRDLGDLSPVDGAELAAAADRQLELAERFDRLVDSMGSVSNEVLAEARRMAIGEQMGRTAEAIRQNQLGQASTGQKQIVADLRKLSEMLSGRGEEKAASQLPDAAQSADPSPAASHPQKTSQAGRQDSSAGPGSTPGSPPGGRSDRAAPRDDIRELLTRFWGQLPPHERGPVQQWAVEDFPPKYQALIEAYYRRLAEQQAAERRQ